MLQILTETAADADEVEWLFDLTFAPGRRALSSYQLRNGVEPAPELCLVARDASGALAGAIRCWPVRVGATGAAALLLGPVAVHPTRQGEGIGASLIGDTLKLGLRSGWERALLIGDEPYYGRFGFRRAGRDLRFPPPTNPDRVLIRSLGGRGFEGISGDITRWS